MINTDYDTNYAPDNLHQVKYWLTFGGETTVVSNENSLGAERANKQNSPTHI